MISAVRKMRRVKMNKDSKKYIRDLKLFLPIHSKKEKQLFSDIKSRLEELTADSPEVTYEQICDELGAPQEVVSEYFFNSDTEYLVKKLRFTQYIRRVFLIVVIAILIVTGVRSYYLHQLYLECTEKDIPTYYIETIE